MSAAITTTQLPSGASTRAPRAGLHGAAASWAAVAAWGAGLILLAVGAGALPQGGAARGAGIALLALGAAAMVWGTATLARGRIVVPRSGVAGALLGIAAATFALAADPVRTSVIAVAAAVALLLSIALACAGRVRALARGSADASPPRLWAIMVAAVVVAGLVTPALGATEAGRNATGHGTHGVVDPGHH